jgi:hypothetical protein
MPARPECAERGASRIGTPGRRSRRARNCVSGQRQSIAASSRWGCRHLTMNDAIRESLGSDLHPRSRIPPPRPTLSVRLIGRGRFASKVQFRAARTLSTRIARSALVQDRAIFMVVAPAAGAGAEVLDRGNCETQLRAGVCSRSPSGVLGESSRSRTGCNGSPRAMESANAFLISSRNFFRSSGSRIVRAASSAPWRLR